jgi:ABC-type nickel/cobalt efflux system permease component RcnA
MKTPGSDHDLIANGGASSVLTALVSVLVLGFLLGMRHATDPDHVVAVTTIVAQQRSLARAARTGVLWGIGHTATILLVGGAIVLLKVQLSGIPARLGLSLELAVAVMLIVLGLLTLAGNDRRVTESTARPVTIGFVHGLAGSAAVATLPQVALIPDPVWAVGYLAVFGAGRSPG